MLSQRNTLAFVVFICGLLMISPLFPYFGIRGIYLMAALLAVILVTHGGTRLRLRPWLLFVSLVVMSLACVPAIYWTDVRYVLMSIFFIFSLFLLQLTDQRVLSSFLTLATGLMLILLVGAVIGFAIALQGNQPLFEISNTDGRPNYFFYTTFSKVRWGNIIRPSGIYDEPGAFSFMICAISALRHLQGRDARVTWLMLGMGFVTLSLAHLVYVLLHGLAERLRFRNFVGIAATLLPLVVAVAYFGGFEIIEKRVLARASVAASGEIVGDNRTRKMINAAEFLHDHPDSVFAGVEPSCRFDINACADKYPLMGENPLSPLVIDGIFISWPYYLVLAALLVAPVFGRKYVVSFAFGALLLQRPYMTGIGYSLVGLLVLATTIGAIVNDRYLRRGLVMARDCRACIVAGHT